MKIEDLTVQLNSLMMGIRVPFTTEFVQQFVDELPTILMTMPDGYYLSELYNIDGIGLVVSMLSPPNGSNRYYSNKTGVVGMAGIVECGAKVTNIQSWVNFSKHMDLISEYMETNK